VKWGVLIIIASACGDDTEPLVDAAADAPEDACACDALPDGAIDALDTDAAPLSQRAPIAGGRFTMGCNQALDLACGADEFPTHQVTLSAFEIDRHEVTQGQYQQCVGAGMCTLPAANYDPAATPDLPARDITWDQARAYCQFAGDRLPTEAEWEKAARGNDGRIYPWGNELPECARANFLGCVGAPWTGAGSAGESPNGEFEAAGNVWEWVADYYDPSYYASSPAQDPTGPAAGSYRVARGGSYATPADALRTSNRVSGDPSLAYDDIGVRCAR
jgi:formylglycine-generating enzyme required for sulfatase activity